MWTWFHKLASPPHFYRIAERLEPWVGWTALLLIIAGVYGGLVLAPPDYQQGEGFRIIYVHVPSAFLSLLIYTVMAIASGIALIWRIKLAHVVATASAPVGASFTFLALATGSIWGKPMWGTWWVWDARLTSEPDFFEFSRDLIHPCIAIYSSEMRNAPAIANGPKLKPSARRKPNM